jgi:hypothetical protein
MEELEEMCVGAMERVITEHGDEFTEGEFYAELRRSGISPSTMIRLWEATRNDYVRVGLIARNSDGSYRKTVEDEEE